MSVFSAKWDNVAPVACDFLFWIHPKSMQRSHYKIKCNILFGMFCARHPPSLPTPSHAREEYFENLVNGREGGDGVQRDPKVVANWVSNNLFGLLKDKFGRSHGQSDNEDELER